MSETPLMKTTEEQLAAGHADTALALAEAEQATTQLAKAANRYGDFDPQNPTSLNEILVVARMFEASGLIGKRDTKEQLATKMIVGRQFGLAPVESLSGLHIIEGRPSLDANRVAARVKKSGRYRYRVIEHTEARCEIEFREKFEGEWDVLGSSTFTLEDATRAGLAGKDTWKKYPKSMLFARALTSGVRTFCADLFDAVPYTPDEIQDLQDDEQVLVPVADTAAERIKATLAKQSEPTEPTTPIVVDFRPAEDPDTGPGSAAYVNPPADAPKADEPKAEETTKADEQAKGEANPGPKAAKKVKAEDPQVALDLGKDESAPQPDEPVTPEVVDEIVATHEYPDDLQDETLDALKAAINASGRSGVEILNMAWAEGVTTEYGLRAFCKHSVPPKSAVGVTE